MSCCSSLPIRATPAPSWTRPAPPELAADVMHHGIYLPGGGSLLYGMDQMIASELGIPVLLSKEPTDCAALGLGNIIENYDLLQHLGRNSFLHEF